MTVAPYDAARGFRSAVHCIDEVMEHRSIGSTDILDDIIGAVRGFGTGVEGVWFQTGKDPKSVREEAVHPLLDGLHDLSIFEGAARVARQRSGYMDIPGEQWNVLHTARNSALKGIDLLEGIYGRLG